MDFGEFWALEHRPVSQREGRIYSLLIYELTSRQIVMDCMHLVCKIGSLPEENPILRRTLLLPSHQLLLKVFRRKLGIPRPWRRIIRTRLSTRIACEPYYRIRIASFACLSELLYIDKVVSAPKDDSAWDLAIILGAHAAVIGELRFLAFQEARNISQSSLIGDKMNPWCIC